MKQVALACPMGVPHFEETIAGITQYVRENDRGWSFHLLGEPGLFSIESLQGWRGDGVIAYLETDEEERIAASMGIPVVNFSAASPTPRVPRVTVDQRQIGRLAAEHFLERGFRRFAFYGIEGHDYSRLREEGFRERLGEHAADCESLAGPSSRSVCGRTLADRHAHLFQWIEEMRKPVGLFAVSDYRARQVVDACNALRIPIPSEVAILGVDNTEIVCGYCDPTLSSISRNAKFAGAKAAQLLDQLMDGVNGHGGHELLIPPGGVVTRRSTDVLAVEDPRLAAAVAFIQENIGDTFSVETLVGHVGVSRRWLEYSFARTFHCTPNEFVNQKRIENARHLLKTDGRIKLYEVARQCGFNSTKQMNAVFRKHLGKTAREFRGR